MSTHSLSNSIDNPPSTSYQTFELYVEKDFMDDLERRQEDLSQQGILQNASLVYKINPHNDNQDGKVRVTLTFDKGILEQPGQHAEVAFSRFIQSILDSQNAVPIFKDVFRSTYFINQFQGSIDQARDPSVFIENSKKVYRSIVYKDKKELQTQFSCSTELLKHLISTKETKHIANREHYKLLNWYIKAIECSEELDIKGVLGYFSKIAEFEGDKATPCKTDSIVDMYVSNVRWWLTHYVCSFNMVGMFDAGDGEIVPVKSFLGLINENIEGFEADKSDVFKEPVDNKPDLLTSTSLYKCMLIIEDVFSLLRQWVQAYSRKCKDNTEDYNQFIKVLNTIELRSDLISQKIPSLINDINNEDYSNHAENYVTFTLHRIAIFLFKVGSAIENFIAKNKLFSPEGCENTLEQVLFSIKIFVSSYNYSLGLEDLDCISSDSKYKTINAIYKKYQQSFEGVEEFLRDEDAINPFVLNGLEGFIPEVLETIKDDGFVVNHNSRDSKDFLDQHKKKLGSFEQLNSHLFDTNQPKVYNNVVAIRDKDELDRLVKEMEEKQESKFCTLLEQINEQNKRFDQKFAEQQERFNQRFDQQNQAIMELVKASNEEFGKLNENINSFKDEINSKIDHLTEADDDLSYHTARYDVEGIVLSPDEKQNFANLLGVTFDDKSDLFVPKDISQLRSITRFFTSLSVNAKAKYNYLVKNCETIEKGLLLLQALEKSFDIYKEKNNK
jgi:hypothetical protein